MPEIKHQFTGGKMNKDLDERLVPNGEYRDALNIQVSTSEGSDVGTVQNILSNSSLLGQGFIGKNAVCVGSVADEKNDKLYWFIAQKELLPRGDFAHAGAGWLTTPYGGTTATPWSFSGSRATATTGAGYMEIPAPSIVKGRTYRITYDVVVADYGSFILANHGVIGGLGTDGTDNNVHLTGETIVGTHSVDWVQGETNVGKIKLYCNTIFEGVIDNISVKEIGEFIVEYDSKTNRITPVLVDLENNTLKFDPDNIITGINIIDDFLFWTDNENEPKKINIQRSIESTHLSGTYHTHFMNDERDLDESIREEHITVIKKAPKIAPTVELISERTNTADEIYTGVMRITSPPSVPLVYGADNWDNTSSLWAYDDSNYNHLYDFSTLSVSDIFETQIETDINGDSGFTLDWELGDTIVFKEYGGEDYDELPLIPIRKDDFRIKAKIIDWEHNRYTDAQTEYTQNSDFAIPNSNGDFPKFYTPTSSKMGYSAIGKYITIPKDVGDEVENWKKIVSSPSQPFAFDSSTSDENIYNVSFTLSDRGSNTPLTGSIWLRIDGPDLVDPTQTNRWTTPMVSTVGTHTFSINTKNDLNTGAGDASTSGKWMFQVATTSWGPAFNGRISNVSIVKEDLFWQVTSARVKCQVLNVNSPPTAPASKGELRFAVDKLDEQEKLFEFKFPRFAYRYQYMDREYSTMSPFSPIAFLPGSFDYHPKKGYNLGMTNRITKVNIKDFTSNIPDGVVAIDILYKDDYSPNIYIVSTIKPKHSTTNSGNNAWEDDEYIVDSEQISQTLPSNQLLRLWDAVPRKALAQDISGNRIIYGNYVQGFDLESGSEDYYPDFNFDVINNSGVSLNPKKSIKSLREYQLGVVFIDEYGRETPVISNVSGSKKSSKLDADKASEIEVGFKNMKYPENMKYFKFFIKETSGEYYNLAMDRYYDAEDGQIWLSFPSSDRNKIDIDTFLILKKGVESNYLIKDEARYKVLDIQSEAPDFIKQNKVLVANKVHVVNSTNIFGTGLVNVPLAGVDNFKMNYDQFHDSSGSNLHEIADSDLYIEFANLTNNTSKRYRISQITTDYDSNDGEPITSAQYSIKLDKKFGDDINFITDSASGLNPTKISGGTIVNIYKYTKENSPKFDGRFFVKINLDSAFNESLTTQENVDTKYRTVLSKKLYYLAPEAENNILHHGDLTGQTVGEYANTFGRFAPFFRNYNKKQFDSKHWSATSAFQPTGVSGQTTESTDPVGEYMFGDEEAIAPILHHSDHPNHAHGSSRAHKELAWITTGQTGYYQGDFEDPPTRKWPGAKVADSHGWTKSQREGVFNAAGEQTHGEVWFIDGGHFVGTRGGSSMHWAYLGQHNQNSVPLRSNETSHLYTPARQVGEMEIAVGGIYHDEVATAEDYSISEFWGIGKDGGNEYYNGDKTKQLVNKFYPGQKFRFKEDPSGEIYTIQPNVGGWNKLRYFAVERNSDLTTTPSDAMTWLSTEHNDIPPGSAFRTDVSPTVNDADVHSDLGGAIGHKPNNSFGNFTGQLSTNFTKSWIPRFVNSSGGGTIDWNPIGSPGIIENGLKLSKVHSSEAFDDDGVMGFTPIVKVDDLLAVDEITGETHSITTGMILTSHSDGATLYDGNAGKEYLAIHKIEEQANGVHFLYLTGYSKVLVNQNTSSPPISRHDIYDNGPSTNGAMIFRQPKMNGYSQYSVNRINAQGGAGMGWDLTAPGIMAIGYNLEFVEAIESESILPSNPAIWETEPKESTDLDIYYEASGLNPLILDMETANTAIPIGSTVEHIGYSGTNFIEAGTTVTVVDTDNITCYLPENKPCAAITLSTSSLVAYPYVSPGHELRITKPNGDIINVTVDSWYGPDPIDGRADTLVINANLYSSKTKYTLNWHNCFSFGNGVESNRIRDTFNLPFISNGVKASTTLEEGHYEERRSGGLIYSGIYNSNGSINNLNQFIAAEKITKDINPIYGSIQKLHSRDSDLVVLCEDKCLRILANKDAIYNADGNPQLTANINVLGQTIPFSGEFGISKNPESFASESYRVYFTDKQRGAVMRLSKDGLTPISMYGMKDWFKDNLRLSTKIIGSYDDRKNEYNVTLANREVLGEELLSNGTFDTSEGWENNSTVGTAWHIHNGVARSWVVGDANGNGGYGHMLIDVPGIIKGKTYRITYDIVIASGGQLVLAHHTTVESILNSHPTNNNVNLINETIIGTHSIDWLQGPTNTGEIDLWNSSDWEGAIDNISVKEVIAYPTTVSFKEDVKGWVSFKSFIPENGISVVNNYHTMFEGKLYKHYNENNNRNNFYGDDYNSSINVILNDGPGSIKTFHTLDYEGSQSKVDQDLGVELLPNGTFDGSGAGWNVNPASTTTIIPWTFSGNQAQATDGIGYMEIAVPEILEGKTYRIVYDIVVPSSGSFILANHTTNASTLNSTSSNDNVNLIGERKVGTYSINWLQGSSNVGKIKLYCDSSFQGVVDNISVKEVIFRNYSNLTQKDGWYASSITTDKQEGNLSEFIEKEGKWFNYIKGIDSDISTITDFGAFDIQGIGILSSISSDVLTFSSDINTSLQVGDTIYFQTPSVFGMFDTIDSNNITKYGDVIDLTNNTITVNLTGSTPVVDDFIIFAKNHAVNTSSLLGYFADVKFENNSTDKIELFSVGSEITESSK